MKENPFLTDKRDRLEKTKKMIKAMKEVKYKKFVALLEMDMGISKDTAKDYIETLENAGFIKKDNGTIISIH